MRPARAVADLSALLSVSGLSVLCLSHIKMSRNMTLKRETIANARDGI